MIYLELLLTFMKIGAFTFGGGYAMLPLIQDEVVSHRWLDSTALVDFIAVSESTPGPFAINIATYVGAEAGGFLGAICATLGVVLPSFIIILIVAGCYEKFKSNQIIKGCMSGLKPAVIGLIAASVLSVASTVFVGGIFTVELFSDTAFYLSLGIFAISVILSIKKIHPILVICISAVIGICFGYLFG